MEDIKKTILESLEKLETTTKGGIDKIKELFGEKQSGFFDLKQENCTDPSHNPPTHLHIPTGKGYRHICPSCKNETIIIPPQKTS